MRGIQYDMTLCQPYYIHCNPDIHNIDAVQASEAIKWPGMRMVVEDCEDVDAFFASLKYIRVDNEYPKFEKQRLQILRGEMPDWKLTSVEVDEDQLHLGFKNEKLFEKYLRRCQELKARNSYASPPAFYSGYLTSYRPDVGAKLRFEVDNPDGSTAVTFVSFYRDGYHITVTEFDGNKRREFNFLHEGVALNKHPVKVTEWML